MRGAREAISNGTFAAFAAKVVESVEHIER